jgi:hypothetical protein
LVNTTSSVENDRANKAILERHIHVNVIRELMQVIAIYGLFPKLSNNVSEYAPQLLQAYDYMCGDDSDINNHDDKSLLDPVGKSRKEKGTEFNNLLASMKSVSFDFGRSVQKKDFDGTTHHQSILPIFVLQKIHSIKQSCDATNTTGKNKTSFKLKIGGDELLRAGKYHGESKPCATYPLNCLQFTKGVSKHDWILLPNYVFDYFLCPLPILHSHLFRIKTQIK